jgi:hypothetical protein
MTTQLQLDTLDRAWIDRSIPLVLTVIRSMGTFEAYDLHNYLDKPPLDRYWGILIARLKHQGHIREVGFGPSKNPKSNGSRVVFWQAI